MHFLILCILSSTGIFFTFKNIGRLGIPSYPVIVINYLVASLLAAFLVAGDLRLTEILHADWLILSVLIGVFFILMFFVIAVSTERTGITVTTVASKMSVVIPITFSILIDRNDTLSPVKAAGILLALTGVLFTVWKPTELKGKKDAFFIPVVLFLGMGAVDALVKYSQHNYVPDENSALFTSVLFAFSFLTGLILYLPVRKSFRELGNRKIWFWGIFLGLVNFGSIYFILRALNFKSVSGTGIDSSIVFGINNIGIVTLSVLLGSLLFREKMYRINWLGILLSAGAFILFMLS